jgi:hypothetical protein
VGVGGGGGGGGGGEVPTKRREWEGAKGAAVLGRAAVFDI